MEAVVAAVRCRPMTTAEELSGQNHAITISPDSKQVIVSNERAFTLNHVYSGKATQNHIFEELVEPVINKVMLGFNACVMAYGQTGSGKTFTMGTEVKAASAGVVHNALQKIFVCSTDFEVHVSFLEIYKEEVLDLLSSGKRKLPVIDFKPKGLTLISVRDVDSALAVMEKGLGNRHVGATNANLHSSRSHAVFTIHYTKETTEGKFTSKLYLVDLAGCECVSDMSGNTKREGLMINKGLLQLGIVMSALSSPGQDHIPYRNSVLTSILKDTLSPQNFLVLIACISPLEVDTAMTLNSLQFASRVGNIKCNPEAGQVIKPRPPITTPFKLPGSYKKRVNTTIDTPGRLGKQQRPILRPLNKTIDSPRTPHVRGITKQFWPTSTPFQNTAKPLFAEPTPIPKRNHAAKRRSSSEWDALDISTSTVVDNATQVKNQEDVNQTNIVPSSENETWLRSIIADVIREELKSHSTFLSQTHRQDGPSPTKKPRRSTRLANTQVDNSSFFNHEADATIVSSSPNHTNHVQLQPDSDDFKIPSLDSIRRSVRISLVGAGFSEASETAKSPQQSQQLEQTTGNRSVRLDTSETRFPVRRSTRLSVVPRPVYTESPKMDKSLLNARKPKVTKKAARMSTRLSILPNATPEVAQKNLNDLVLDILKLGDLKKLQSLPTIGPKTAVVISNHRLLHGPIRSFKDLKNIQGLSANFTKRFLWANNIVLEGDDEDDE